MTSSKEFKSEGQNASHDAIEFGYKGIRLSGILNFLIMAIKQIEIIKLPPAESPVKIIFL